MKENWPPNKWPAFKRIVNYKGINIWQSRLRFCFVNFSFFFCQILGFSPSCFCQNRIVSKIEKVIRFDLGKNIRFDKEIRFNFDSIWQPCYESREGHGRFRLLWFQASQKNFESVEHMWFIVAKKVFGKIYHCSIVTAKTFCQLWRNKH
jgi:hypothetical protein